VPTAIETHEYQCPCDMCEPEAHSVRELPPGPGSPVFTHPSLYHVVDLETEPLRPGMRKRSAPTVAPGPADAEVAAFESLVKQVGEGKARWSKLLELLEGSEK
jgi:hypothetical protein